MMTVYPAQKTPIARTLEQFGARKALEEIGKTGQSLPVSVVSVVSSGIVKVKFEIQQPASTSNPYTLPNITVPILFPEYVRVPIQPKMKGMVVDADAYLGGVSGLGGGIADLTPRPNLSNLAFMPIGNTAWTPPIDPNSVELYGVGTSGVILRDGGKVCVFTLTDTGLIITINGVVVFQVAAGVVTVPEGLAIGGNITAEDGSSVYTGNFHTTGTVTADTNVVTGSVDLGTHKHGGVQTGSGETGGPTG